MNLVDFETGKLVGKFVSWTSSGKEKFGLVLETLPPGAAITKLPESAYNDSGDLLDCVRFRTLNSSATVRRLLVAAVDLKGSRGKVGKVLYYAPNFESCRLASAMSTSSNAKTLTYLRGAGLYNGI